MKTRQSSERWQHTVWEALTPYHGIP